MAVDRLDDLLLLGSVHADGPERLPGAAIRADEGLVVLPGKGRSAVVSLAAKRADRQSCDRVISHGCTPPCIFRKLLPAPVYQNGRYHILPYRCACSNHWELQ